MTQAIIYSFSSRQAGFCFLHWCQPMRLQHSAGYKIAPWTEKKIILVNAVTQRAIRSCVSGPIFYTGRSEIAAEIWRFVFVNLLNSVPACQFIDWFPCHLKWLWQAFGWQGIQTARTLKKIMLFSCENSTFHERLPHGDLTLRTLNSDLWEVWIPMPEDDWGQIRFAFLRELSLYGVLYLCLWHYCRLVRLKQN